MKARNVLVTHGYEGAKLCDFGLARAMPDQARPAVNPEMTPRIGPPKYRAPEVGVADIARHVRVCRLTRDTRAQNTSDVGGEQHPPGPSPRW